MVARNKAVVIVHRRGVQGVPIDHAQRTVTAYKLEQGHRCIGIFAVAIALALGIFLISDRRPVHARVCHTARIDQDVTGLQILVCLHDGGGNTGDNRVKVLRVMPPIEAGVCARLPIAAGAGMGMRGTDDHIIEGVDFSVAQLQTRHDFQRNMMVYAA